MKRRQATPRESFDVFAWNVHKGNPWKRIENVLDSQVRRGRPRYIALQEVVRHVDELGAWAVRNGYRVVQERAVPERSGQPVPEHGSTALLVDRRCDGFDHLSDRHMVMRKAWRVFSKDRWHRPRRYPISRDRTDGGVIRVLAAHFPTNGADGGNRVAFAESVARVSAWAARRLGRTLVVVVGDVNDKLPWVKAWARTFGGRAAGHNVDACIVVGGTVVGERLGDFGSDHPAMRYTVTRG